VIPRRFSSLLLAWLCALLLWLAPHAICAQEGEDAAGNRGDSRGTVTTIAGLSVAYWLPEETAYPAPLILFSHGLGGCKTQSKFLMQALAEDGYVVVAPDHADAGCGHGLFGRPAHKFRRPEDWDSATYRNRGDDLRRLYDALKHDKTWSARIDWKRVGLAGHSLGGYTVLALAGGWKDWTMPGIGAVLALSPYCKPLALKGSLEALHVPVMYQGGTRDFGITPAVKKTDGCYDKTAAPAWFIEFDRTGHFGWTDLQTRAQPLVVDYSLWFFDHALKGAKAPLPEEDGVADLRQK
jgi:dienelactone hydrolase